MKDPADTITTDLIPSPKGRGRPKTGKAMTPAERKRAQRERDRAQVEQIETGTHKAAPRILAEALHAKDRRAFLAWLEMGERAGWLNSYDRGQILKHNTPKA